MPPPIRSLRCLERYAHLGAPLADWKREAGDGFAAIEPLLKETDRLASRWSRPGRPAMRIIEHEDGRAVAVCDEESDEPMELAHSDRVLRRACESQLRARLCGVLGLSPSREPVTRLPGTLPVGDWRPRPATNVSVKLAVAATVDQFPTLLMDVAKGQGPSLVLTPTRAAWSSRCDALLTRGRIALVPLDEVLDERQGTWYRLPAWDAYANTALPVVPESLQSDDQSAMREQVGRLKEMERDVIIALAEKGIVGVNAANQPGQALLAKWAGYGFDATFKAAVSALVKSRLLDNGRHHGRRGGYFLTTLGRQAAEFINQS